MKIYSINNVYSNQQKNGYTVKKSCSNNVQAASRPSCKGDLGRGLGAVTGFLTVAAGCAACAALSIAFPIAPIVAAGVATKAFGDAGSKLEDDLKNKNKPNK